MIHGVKRHWPTIKAKLLAGEYTPAPVRRVDIPKPQGGVRTLGIPTLTDRLIQQALHQVLSPIFEAEFSESSYGFRPGRNAHQAIKAAKQYVAEGRRVVVDMDLERFFDRVNHDLLMQKLSTKIGDRRVLRLIRRYLEAGMMAEGVVSPRTEGTPQGGPLSPLLSNILLTELDRELERRGHTFCRYADDCNIYVKSKEAGERVMASITWFLADTLRLTVNAAKSAIACPWEWKFLGYSLTKVIAELNPILRGSMAWTLMPDCATPWRSCLPGRTAGSTSCCPCAARPLPESVLVVEVGGWTLTFPSSPPDFGFYPGGN